MKTIKVHVLTMGKDLYYATEDYEDAKYEKQTAEEENWQGRKQNIKLTEVELDAEQPDMVITLSNKCTYTVEQIMNLL